MKHIKELEIIISKEKEKNERLQHIIDSRPAINAGLVESYIEWSQGIYALDIINVVGKNS